MSEHKFPTEVIDLPSGGKVYSKDSPLADGKIELKYIFLFNQQLNHEYKNTTFNRNCSTYK